MSPQNHNVIIELCGLSISHLFKPSAADAVWETAVLENTGAPDHGGDHAFEMRWPDGFSGEFTAQNLPSYHNRTRTIVITPEKCNTPATEYRPSPSDTYSIEHIGDFSTFEPNGEVNFRPSNEVLLTKVKVFGGEAFTSRFADGMYTFNNGSSKQLGKCLAFRLECEIGSSIEIAAANDNGESFKYTLQVPVDKHLVIQLHNDCDNPTTIVDFPYYYNDDGNFLGIVDPRNMATLHWQISVEKEMLSGKVACNAMRASKLEWGGSLWDAVKL
jgi:hypothetical protein